MISGQQAIGLSPLFQAPANSSRFFEDQSEAVMQPLGSIQLVWDHNDKIIVNQEYLSELIKYDSQYCTSVSSIGDNYVIPMLAYIDLVFAHLGASPVVIDIGCGQGEFVIELRNRNVDAWGFDPVVRTKSPFLQQKYWNPKDKTGDLYVMRCVLPHIQNPWEFLTQIAKVSPKALILIEFQRIEWILEHKVWYQISHDHVNLFSISDFSQRFNMIDSGTFSKGEWGWVLIDLSHQKDLNRCFPKSYNQKFQDLFSEKNIFLNQISEIQSPIAIWGAAGKGIVLAHALIGLQKNLFAIDADPHRWGKYLEGSGVLVISPADFIDNAVGGTVIFVCNPNHFDEVRKYLGDKFDVRSPSTPTH